jgi:hypothetical protein
MKVNDFIKSCDNNNIPRHWYAINKGLFPDTYILQQDYNSKWRFFYLDEKRNELDVTYFDTEEEACEHLYNKLLKELQYKAKY